MLFALGYISGVVTCIFIAVLLAYFKAPLMMMLPRTLAGPRAKGFIYEPESEAEIARQEHIAKNAKEGKDTRIEELM